MASKEVQYVLVPAAGLVASETNPEQIQLFQALQQTVVSPNPVRSMSTHTGVLPVKVLDSIGEKKAKLIQCSPDDLPALRASHPSVRILPVVYYRPAVMRYEIGSPVGVAATRAKVRAAKPSGITIAIVSAKDGKPVAKAMVVAFTDFAAKAGAQGTTNAHGQVTLALGGSSKKIERLYVYPALSFWPGLQENITLKAGAKIPLLPVDLTFTDCVRFFYPGNDLTFGRGVTVGVIDCGVATNHPDLVVSGGQNTVTGEKPGDFGDNGSEGHGTHVAGIIAARGTPPKGIRGVAPGVTLRSYRVFGQGAPNASNFAIAKAIDAGVADKCDLLNMSLGGGDPDTLTAEALTAAHNAGVVVLAANGNDSRQPVSFPAANSLCQAVSAMGRIGTFPKDTEPAGSVAAPYGKDKKNFIADFSNIGPETDLTGPGVGVMSTLPGGFGVMSGTSMATPAETGAAARLLATKPAILAMARDQNRASAMVSAIAAACKLFGFGPTFEGKGMISV
ncbi:MAG TPA: S8 family serine peptidase [Dongiaceae bacterium]|nr:S8 family serine peptidase [Dongiaceae bacterium]